MHRQSSPAAFVVFAALWRAKLFAAGHRPQERACEGAEGCGLNVISSASGGGGNEQKTPLALFILAPLTRGAILEFKSVIEARKPRRVDIYSSSDSLRCGNGRGNGMYIGNQLPSQVAGCQRLLKDIYNNPGDYANLFGDHLNQAWLADEWKMLMQYINEVHEKGTKVNVYIYPYELLNNPTAAAKLAEFKDPKEFVRFENASDIGREWKDMGMIQKYWYLWSLSSSYNGVKRQPFSDLAVVMDFVLRHDAATRELALSHSAEKAEWCIAKQYKIKDWCRLKPANHKYCESTMPMVYVDLQNDQFAKYCTSNSALVNVVDDVNVALPKDAEKFDKWLEKYKSVVDEIFTFKPSKPGFYNKIAQRAISMDVVIYQDAADADDFASVLWLLKSLRFQYTRLVVTNRPANFRIHKYRQLSKTKEVLVEANMSHHAKGSEAGGYKLRVDEGTSYSKLLLNSGLVTNEELLGVGSAFPFLCKDDPKSGRCSLQGQKCYVADDSSLMEKHTLWRWNQWLKRMTVLGVEVVGDGGARTTPVSHAIFPYTFYFYNETKPFEDPDFVVPYSEYAKKEARARRDTIWEDLKYVFKLDGNELQELAEEQDAADSGLQRSRARYQCSNALIVLWLCVGSTFSVIT